MDNSRNTTNQNNNEPVESFSLTEILKVFLRKWVWFLCSLAFFLGLGFLYIAMKQPVFERSTEILIKDSDSGGGVGDIGSAFGGLSMFSSNSSVYNELIALMSPSIMYEVVDCLDLTMNYSMKTNPVRWSTLYGTNLPIDITFDGLNPEKSVGFKGYIQPDRTLRIYEFYTFDTEGNKHKFKEERVLRPGQTVNTPIGKISSAINPKYNGKEIEETKFQAWHKGRQKTVENYLTKLKGDLANPDAEVISLSIDDASVQRADNILKSIVDIYNQRWIDDKNRMAIATSKFIEDRLVVLQQELGDVDTEISQFRSEYKMSDPTESGRISMEKQMESQEQIYAIENRIGITRYLLDFVKNPQNSDAVIPINTGTGSAQIEGLIGEYDNMLANKNNLLANSSSSNPVVADLERQLKERHSVIQQNIEKHLDILNRSLQIQKKELGISESYLTNAPLQSKQLLGAQRQQSVKASLYLYLLQRREENELGQKFTADNTRIITPPYGSSIPVSPKKKLIIVLMLFLGLGIPAALAYVEATSDDKVRNRKELDNLPMPFLGEIPYVGKKKRKGLLRKIFNKKKDEEEVSLKLVKEGSRDIANEAFRVIRSNIDMMIGKGKGCQTVMLTSANVGSGKSFITYNLGLTYGLKKKRVLMIDCDLRHSSLSMFVDSPRHGLSDYLSDSTDDWKSLVVPVEDTVRLLPVGHRPPNPAELLENGRLEALLKEAKEEYDIILLDCPPVDIVVDTQIVQQMADRIIFVIRAGVFRKQDLSGIARREEASKHHMSIILNATETQQSLYHANGSSNYYTTK